MPRAKTAPLFELAGQWIAREPGRRNLYHFATDAGSQRTARRSLGTTDLETAKLVFAERVVKAAPKTRDSLLSAVLLQYFTERTDELPCRKQSRNAGRIVLKAWGNGVTVSELTSAKQKAFAQWSLSKGFRLSYAVRNLIVVKAALNHCDVPPPAKIVTSASAMRQRWGLVDTAPPRETFIPIDDELARLLRAKIPERLKRWIVISLLTGCRPEAALDLAPPARRRDAGLVNLNPKGRVQNKKHRPIVREPRVLRACLDRWEKDGLDAYGGRYCGYTSIEGVKSALDRLRLKKDVALPGLSLYSFRHKVVSVLRARRVPEDQIARQLGHRRRDLRTTSGYGEFDPDYLKTAARALDSWFLELRARVKSHAKPAIVGTRTKKAA